MKIESLLVVLSVIGLFSSLLALRDYYSGTPVCRVDERWNCKSVYSIPEAEFLGIHLTFLAPIYFTVLTLLSTIYLYTNMEEAMLLFTILSVLGAVLVPYLVYLEARVAHAFCLYCTIMHVVILCLTVSSLYMHVR